MPSLILRLCLPLALLQLPAFSAETEVSPASAPSLDPSSDLLEHLVDSFLQRIGVETSGNTLTHWLIFTFLFLAAWFLRKILTTSFFSFLKHLASKTKTTFDDKLFPALESPFKAFIFVFGSYAAFKVLKLSPVLDSTLLYLFKVAFPGVIFWGLILVLDAIIDHLGEMANARGMGIAAFLPLLKKTILAVFIILAGLTIVQSFGYDVKTFLAGLGIGGLAIALAAQDTIANLFGSFVVAIDQPFKVGDFVQIGANTGTVEDIGMRSTKLRTSARTLIAIPNRSVANDAVINFSRMPQRRVDLTLGLTYDTHPNQLEELLQAIRQILKEDPDVHQELILVHFINYGASALELQILYFTSNPDWKQHFTVRERINLKIMHAVNARGLSFAFPTQTIHFDGKIAQSLVGQKALN